MCTAIPPPNPPIFELIMLSGQGNSLGVGDVLVLSSSHPLPTATFLLLNLG